MCHVACSKLVTTKSASALQIITHHLQMQKRDHDDVHSVWRIAAENWFLLVWFQLQKIDQNNSSSNSLPILLLKKKTVLILVPNVKITPGFGG